VFGWIIFLKILIVSPFISAPPKRSEITVSSRKYMCQRKKLIITSNSHQYWAFEKCGVQGALLVVASYWMAVSCRWNRQRDGALCWEKRGRWPC